MLTAKFPKGCVFLVLVCTSTVGRGQYRGGEGPPRFYKGVRCVPFELAFGYHHASTALEGALRSRGEVIHATGDYWLAVSQAQIGSEQCGENWCLKTASVL